MAHLTELIPCIEVPARWRYWDCNNDLLSWFREHY